ncbi:ABC transporter permease [Brevibacillus migulae]|uniref:ABC transporter permease n=1 Tax=Brevibacillus migulae TaxID=1644114 RepID=UPI001430AEDA|nr:ABC transporter permease [Brevibacillus migulae]
MNRLYANILNESHKLYARKITKITLLLTVAAPVLAALLVTSFQRNTGIILGDGSHFLLMMLDLFTSFLLPFFLFVTIADLFTGEAASNTLTNVLVRPISRTKIFASKVAVIALYTLFCLALMWLGSTIVGFFFDSGNVFDTLLASSASYFLAFFPMLAVGLIAVCLVMWVDHSVSALALCLLIYTAARLLPFFYPQAVSWTAFDYTDWHEMWIGNGATWGQLLQVSTLLLSNCIIGYTAGWYRFEKKQF